jgi:lipoprotein-releasing system ATP-binding protein
MNNLMIEAKSIRKQFGDLQVLRNINLEIRAQEITSIAGASGAGKTTLLQILGTLDKADSGELQIGGKNTKGLRGGSLAAFRNEHIGFIFQNHRLLPEFSALENVLMPAWVAGKEDSVTKDRAAGLLRDLGLGDRLSHRPAQMSGGEQQRVAAARSLMNKPAVVLADEPTGNLDSGNAESLFDLFVELRNREGQTFVVVTHNEKLAARADRTVLMRDGMIIP